MQRRPLKVPDDRPPETRTAIKRRPLTKDTTKPATLDDLAARVEKARQTVEQFTRMCR